MKQDWHYEDLYGFTYKKLKQDPSEEEYKAIVKQLESKGEVISYVSEEDSKGKLHIHGVIRLRKKNPYFKSLNFEGFHSKYEPIYDLDGWNRYMLKHNKIDNKQYMF